MVPGTYDPEHGEDHHSKDQHAEVQRQKNHAEVPDSHLQPEMWPLMWLVQWKAGGGGPQMFIA